MDEKPKRRWFRFGLRTMFVMVTIFGVLAGLLWKELFSTPPLPNASSISSMHAQLGSHRQQVNFDIPPAYCGQIMQALSTAKRDPFPPKWAVYGKLDVRLTDGSGYLINLYDSLSDKLAFSAGRDWDSRAYYLGEGQSDLFQALKEAEAAAEHR